MKKHLGWMAAWLAVCGCAWAGGTVVVAPARISVIQVGQDLAARNGVTLVSYQGEATTARPLVYVWDGTQWNYVSLEAFQAGSFLPEKPAQTLVIGDEKLVPEVFAPMAAWAGKLQKIPQLGTTDILNAAGPALKFSKDDLAWFASRYNLKAEDINAAERQDSIYNHKVGEPLKLQNRAKGWKAGATTPPPAALEPAEKAASAAAVK